MSPLRGEMRMQSDFALARGAYMFLLYLVIIGASPITLDG